jgi:hypothetical protein
VNTARNWTVGIKLGLHLVRTLNVIVVGHVVLDVRLNCEASIKTVLIRSGWWPGAVTAYVDWRAFTSL